MDDKLLSKLLAGVTVIVTLAWVISFLAPILRPDYHPPQEINVVMMGIVGLFVQLTLKSKSVKRGDDDE